MPACFLDFLPFSQDILDAVPCLQLPATTTMPSPGQTGGDRGWPAAGSNYPQPSCLQRRLNLPHMPSYSVVLEAVILHSLYRKHLILLCISLIMSLKISLPTLCTHFLLFYLCVFSVWHLVCGCVGMWVGGWWAAPFLPTNFSYLFLASSLPLLFFMPWLGQLVWLVGWMDGPSPSPSSLCLTHLFLLSGLPAHLALLPCTCSSVWHVCAVRSSMYMLLYVYLLLCLSVSSCNHVYSRGYSLCHL